MERHRSASDGGDAQGGKGAEVDSCSSGEAALGRVQNTVTDSPVEGGAGSVSTASVAAKGQAMSADKGGGALSGAGNNVEEPARRGQPAAREGAAQPSSRDKQEKGGGEEEAEGVAVKLGVPLSVPLGVLLGVPLGVAEGVAVCERVWLGVTLAVPLSVPLSDAVALGVLLTVGV